MLRSISRSARHRIGPGSRIGDHLELRSVLGRGGSAVVYEALHTRLRCAVAVKVVDVDAPFVDDANARMHREAQVCAAIEDAHVPKVYDVGELDDGTRYIVMEKVSGLTLERLLDAGPLDRRRALSITRDLLSALDVVHRAGVVHRDIKPSNLIVQGDDPSTLRVRLMDFGVSKAPASSAEDPRITHEGTIVGTPCYMAPEQITDEGVDARTDLYAVGVLLYEMLASRVPFDGRTTAEVMGAVLSNEHVSLAEAAPSVPRVLCDLVERAIAPRPDDRFASASAMRDALDQAIERIRTTRRVVATTRNVARHVTWATLPIAAGFLLAVWSRSHEPASAPEPVSVPLAAAAALHVAREAPQTPSLPGAEASPKAATAQGGPAQAQAVTTQPKTSSPRVDRSPRAERTAAGEDARRALISSYTEQLEALRRAPISVEPRPSLSARDPLPENPYE